MITTLLSLALSLLIAAQQPNVPLHLKNQAIAVATMAIQMATTPSTEATTTVVSAPVTTDTAPVTITTPVSVPTYTPAPSYGAITQTSDIIQSMTPINFTGWDGTKVVLSGGQDASTTITVQNGANQHIKIYRALNGVDYTQLLVDDTLDSNGQYVFAVGKWNGGSFTLKFKTSSIDENVDFLVSN